MKTNDPEHTRPAEIAATDDPANDPETQLTQLREENARLKGEMRLGTAHRLITEDLKMAGARSPELMFSAVKAELQFGDDGTLLNAAALVNRLRTAFPEQFGSQPTISIDAGAGRQAAPRLTREALARMKPAEVASLDWDLVKDVLARG